MNQYGPESNSSEPTTESRFHVLKSLAVLIGAVAAAAAAANAVIALRSSASHHLLGGVFGRYPYRHGALGYVVAGHGTPLLLLHGLGAGNSMNEWSANFEHLKQNHTVYAFDFPGWGLSDKPECIFTAEEYIEPILFFVEDIIGEPCALMASSDACSFAIEAAARRPDLVNGLVLICPSTRDQDAATEKTAPLVQHFFQIPILGRAVFNAIASRGAIRSFASRHLYYDKSKVTEALVARYHAGAHECGAERGFAAFFSGALNFDVREAWSELTQPALLVWGRNARINSLATAPEWLALKNDARLEVIDEAMLLPHTERADEFNAIVDAWLEEQG